MTYSRVLVGSDLSETSLQALRRAASFAHERATFRVVFVQPDTWPPSAGTAAHERRTREALELLRAALGRTGMLKAERAVVTGSVARELAREAAEFQADLVVVGHRGTHRRRALGSTSRHLLRSVGVDTLVVRPPTDRSIGPPSILVATDFQAPSRRAGERAAALAKHWGASVELVHCIDPAAWYDMGLDPDLGAIARELERFNAKAFGGAARETILRGRPGREVPREAAVAKADVVVVGNHGPGGIERALLGSVAEAIAEKAHCSVLVVRG